MKASQIVALDDFALQAARGLSERMPRCDNTIPQLPSTTPVLTDITVISRPQAIPGGGYDYGVSLAQLQALIGGGGGVPSILFNTNLNPLTVYNYGNYVNTPAGSAATNTAALATMFAEMASPSGNQGGWAWIPQYLFPVSANSSPLIVPPGVIMQALGTGGQSGGNKQFHFSITDGGASGPYTFFDCQGAHTSGGTFFKNLAFNWSSPAYAGDTAILYSYWNGGADGCTFTNCPVALNILGLGVKINQCQISYGLNGLITPANTTAIWMGNSGGNGAINCEIAGPSEFMGNNLGTSACIGFGGGPKNCNLNTIRNIHMYQWAYGVDYGDVNGLGISSGTQQNIIDTCHIEVQNTAINMQPTTAGGQFGLIYGEKITNCTLAKGQNSQNGAAVVFIDANGGAPSNVANISLIGNTIFSNVTGGSGQSGAGLHTGIAQSNQYGVQIGTAASVSIIGGQISGLGTNAGSDGTANVCISGAATLVVINGVNLSAAFIGTTESATGSTGAAPTEYALLITGACGRVSVNNCPMIGQAVPVAVTGSVIELVVTNCVGYNDQNTNIVGNGTISTGVAYKAATAGTVLGGTATNYFGPSFIMFTANSSGGTVAINGGTPQTLVDSQIVCLYLNSPYDSIEFATHAPSALQWLGK